MADSPIFSSLSDLADRGSEFKSSLAPNVKVEGGRVSLDGQLLPIGSDPDLAKHYDASRTMSNFFGKIPPAGKVWGPLASTLVGLGNEVMGLIEDTHEGQYNIPSDSLSNRWDDLRANWAGAWGKPVKHIKDSGLFDHDKTQVIPDWIPMETMFNTIIRPAGASDEPPKFSLEEALRRQGYDPNQILQRNTADIVNLADKRKLDQLKKDHAALQNIPQDDVDTFNRTIGHDTPYKYGRDARILDFAEKYSRILREPFPNTEPEDPTARRMVRSIGGGLPPPEGGPPKRSDPWWTDALKFGKKLGPWGILAEYILGEELGGKRGDKIAIPNIAPEEGLGPAFSTQEEAEAIYGDKYDLPEDFASKLISQTLDTIPYSVEVHDADSPLEKKKVTLEPKITETYFPEQTASEFILDQETKVSKAQDSASDLRRKAEKARKRAEEKEDRIRKEAKKLKAKVGHDDKKVISQAKSAAENKKREADKKKKEADALQKAHDDFMKQLTEASRRRSLMNRLHRGVGPNQFLYDI